MWLLPDATISSGIGRYLRSLAVAFSAAAAAVAAQRQPSEAALWVPGIEPVQFRTIRFK